MHLTAKFQTSAQNFIRTVFPCEAPKVQRTPSENANGRKWRRQKGSLSHTIIISHTPLLPASPLNRGDCNDVTICKTSNFQHNSLLERFSLVRENGEAKRVKQHIYSLNSFLIFKSTFSIFFNSSFLILKTFISNSFNISSRRLSSAFLYK